MSGLTDRLREVATEAIELDKAGFHWRTLMARERLAAELDPVLVERMLDVIEAAEALVDAPRGSPNGEGLGRAKVRDRLARFREVAG